MLKGFLRKTRRLIWAITGLGRLSEELAHAKVLNARLLIELQRQRTIVMANPQEAEFKVFSQFGDDGIIQFLIHRIGIPRSEQVFVEFGVENFEESNTRFLLMNDNWRGLVIDGDADNVAHIKASSLYWRHDLTALTRFVDRDNINEILRSGDVEGAIGLLSIDVDGNDYWIWESIDIVSPRIVIVEYNSVFGPDLAITVPYDPAFDRTRAHYSNLYWGCSLKGLELIGRKKGYILVGSNSAGNNAYFVRQELASGLKALSASDAYVESRFRESRDLAGRQSYLRSSARWRQIEGMPVYDIARDQVIEFTLRN